MTLVGLQELERKLTKCPVEAGTFPHWLIINGKQPAIPENAVISRRQPPPKRRKIAADQKPGEAPRWASCPLLVSSPFKLLISLQRCL